jgi:hypothetical protein
MPPFLPTLGVRAQRTAMTDRLDFKVVPLLLVRPGRKKIFAANY